jgi:hypothetical protein
VRLQAGYLGLVFICGWGSNGIAGAISELAKLSLLHCVPLRLIGHGEMQYVHGKLCEQSFCGQLGHGCKDLHHREGKVMLADQTELSICYGMAWRCLHNVVWLQMLVAANIQRQVGQVARTQWICGS